MGRKMTLDPYGQVPVVISLFKCPPRYLDTSNNPEQLCVISLHLQWPPFLLTFRSRVYGAQCLSRWMELYELFLVAVRIQHDQVPLTEGGGIEGLTGLQRETWKQAAGSGSRNITEVEGANGKKGHAMNSQSLSPEQTQQGHNTFANRVSHWGSNVQTPESVWDTMNQITTEEEYEIILTNNIHFILIDLEHISSFILVIASALQGLRYQARKDVWYTTVTPVPRSLRQKDCRFESGQHGEGAGFRPIGKTMDERKK